MKYFYDNENYEKAFFLLKLCFKDYKKNESSSKVTDTGTTIQSILDY